MELQSLRKSALFSPNGAQKLPLSTSIFNELVDMLYRKNRLAIPIQLVAGLGLVIGLWGIISPQLIITWVLYMLAVYSSWYTLTLFYKRKKQAFDQHRWLIILAIVAFLAGIGWGFAGSVMIPADNFIHQTFAIILIFAMTATSLAFFSPIIYIYSLFLFPAFIPFDIWLFAQGELYILLGIFALIYLIVLLGSSYYLNQFLIDTLKLRYKNESLDTLNQLLEKRVTNRTEELEKSLAITKSTLESTADGILVINLEGNIGYFNHKFLDMWQISQKEMSKPDLKLLVKEISTKIKDPRIFHKILEEINQNPSHEIFNEIVMKDSRVYEWYSKPHLMRNIIAGYAWNFRDITMRKQMERQLAYQANHDLLTGLPNRTLLFDRIDQSISYAKRYQTQIYLLFLDIDNFKLINDSLGHNLGDLLLQKIAERLTSITRESDTISRFGGDEFIILLVTNKYSDILKLSQNILEKIAQPIQLQEQEIVVSASIGVSAYPEDGKDAATLLKNADMAMYLAKKQGRNSFKLYDETMKKHSEKTLAIQMELRKALTNNELYLLYQPIINLKTGETEAVEALIRWNHPNEGILLPEQFIPIAEESRLIILLGEWVFRTACLQNQVWQKMGLKPISVAINVSSIQFMRDNFADLVRQIVDDSQLDPQYIEIEITESNIMDNKKQNIHTLKRLKEMGINLTIDDFGTGYSSLNYLHEFPVHKLKIDQSFIRECTTDGKGSIVDAIITMAHGLKLKVLAEGIETIDQLRYLQERDCDEGQGFLYCHPMEAEAFVEYFQAETKKR